MITAASNPYSSLAGNSNTSKISPPYSISTPSRLNFLPISWISEPSEINSLCERNVTSITAKAVVPDGLILPGVSKGLDTVTPEIWATWLNISVMDDLISSDVTPLGEVNTICPPKPARSGLLASRSSRTSFDSLFGSSNCVAKFGPTEFEIAPKTMTSSNQNPTINRRWRTEKRARRINMRGDSFGG